MAQAAAKAADMFVWEGTDKRGKKVKGEMSGQSDAIVKATLRRQGINVGKVKKKPKPLFGLKKKITAKDIAVFSRQMATMMSAGVPLVQSFEIVGRGHENAGMQELILSVKSDVESGNTLADALAKHPLHFDELFVNLVRAGEAGGILETLLDKIATYKEKTEVIKSKIKKALFYPAAVLVMAVVITAVLMIFVIPQFAALFRDFGADLPAMTQMVINMSDFVVANVG
ncbi:MAG: type II secretion system F family protein, partial [Gammaproteobacteria bacterium]|nr:type II secretion system F family protein [Gammaproteobacteria bacterium]